RWRRRDRANANAGSAGPAAAALAGAAAADDQFTIFSGMHGGHCFGERAAAAALRAVLHKAAVFLRCLDALAAFKRVVADRLLDVHVFAGLAGQDGDQRVPVVARRDRTGIQFFVFERSADVLDHLGLRLLPLFDSIYLDRRLLGIGINEVGHLH